MLCTAEIDMANTVVSSDIDTFLTDVAWAIRSTYHTVLKASPGAAIFGRDMLFNIPFMSDWKQIGNTYNAKLISKRFYFSGSHSNSPIVVAIVIGQETTYTCKISVLPTEIS